MDFCGNFILGVQVIWVCDFFVFDFICLLDIIIFCDVDFFDFSIIGMVIDMVDVCGGLIIVIFFDEIVLGSCDNSYFIER